VAHWIQRLGFERLVLMDDGSDYGVGLAGIIEVALRDLGLDSILRASGSQRSDSPEELDRLADEITAQQPDLLYVGAGANRATLALLRRVRATLPGLPLMGSDALMRQETMDLSGELEGLYVTTPAWLDERSASARGRAFQERYCERFGRPPLPIAASSYEAMQVLFLAIDRAEAADRAGVLAAMHQLEEIDGILGRWRFRPGGDTSLQEISGLQLRDGDWHFVEALN
jgi:branched-chain amino acid transport system substrate-binding protein